MPKSAKKRKGNGLNTFFDKIFVISLYDKTERWKKVSKQFKNRKIDVERFIAVDGRCKNEGKEGCIQKMKSFEIMYDVKISNKKKLPIGEVIPAASLTIGTILLLRQMVKQKWEHMLICEDDIELTKDFEKKFKQGIKELGNTRWDLLYLGCGNKCGNKGISLTQDGNKKFSPLAEWFGDEFYVDIEEDLRLPCEGDCEPFSEHISKAYSPGGTWCYAYSLAGAKKILKFLNNDAGNHIDQLIAQSLDNEDIKAYAFDPPIVYHEGGILRADSDIPW